MAKKTQVDRIKDYIRDFGSITSWEAMKEIGVGHLSSRISEMRQAGINVVGTMKPDKNRYGDKIRYMVYTIPEEE